MLFFQNSYKENKIQIVELYIYRSAPRKATLYKQRLTTVLTFIL